MYYCNCLLFFIYISSASTKTDSLDRFIGVVRYFLSGWHIKPKVRKKKNMMLSQWFFFFFVVYTHGKNWAQRGSTHEIKRKHMELETTSLLYTHEFII